MENNERKQNLMVNVEIAKTHNKELNDIAFIQFNLLYESYTQTYIIINISLDTFKSREYLVSLCIGRTKISMSRKRLQSFCVSHHLKIFERPHKMKIAIS